MLHISLFSGIGGFDLASERVGWTNIASCEINPFGRKVLEYYWPTAYHHDDIKTLTYTKLNEELTKKHGADWRADDIVLTGGFPCQPYSLAGKRLGTEDERHLWPEMLRIIREVSPKWVVGENVFGLVNWSNGLVFHEVQTDLEALGYEVQSYVLPACGVNAPHRRDRIFIVAHSNLRGGCRQKRSWNDDLRGGKSEKSYNKPIATNSRLEKWEISSPTTHANNTGNTSPRCSNNGHGSEISEKRQHALDEPCGHSNERTTTDTERIGHTRRTETSGNDNAERIGWMDTDGGRNGDEIRGEIERCSTDTGNADATDSDTERLQCKGESAELEGGRFSEYNSQDDANTTSERLEGSARSSEGRSNSRPTGNNQPTNWDNFPTQSPICSRNDGLSTRLDGITFPKWRNESIKAGGNAVVPPLIYNIFKTIQQYEDDTRNNI